MFSYFLRGTNFITICADTIKEINILNSIPKTVKTWEFLGHMQLRYSLPRSAVLRFLVSEQVTRHTSANIKQMCIFWSDLLLQMIFVKWTLQSENWSSLLDISIKIACSKRRPGEALMLESPRKDLSTCLTSNSLNMFSAARNTRVVAHDFRNNISKQSTCPSLGKVNIFIYIL